MENNYEIIKNKFGQTLRMHPLTCEERIIERKIEEIIDNLNFRGVFWNSSSPFTKYTNI